MRKLLWLCYNPLSRAPVILIDRFQCWQLVNLCSCTLFVWSCRPAPPFPTPPWPCPSQPRFGHAPSHLPNSSGSTPAVRGRRLNGGCHAAVGVNVASFIFVWAVWYHHGWVLLLLLLLCASVILDPETWCTCELRHPEDAGRCRGGEGVVVVGKGGWASAMSASLTGWFTWESEWADTCSQAIFH